MLATAPNTTTFLCNRLLASSERSFSEIVASACESLTKLFRLLSTNPKSCGWLPDVPGLTKWLTDAFAVALDGFDAGSIDPRVPLSPVLSYILPLTNNFVHAE
jgi:hypothetical protein